MKKDKTEKNREGTVFLAADHTAQAETEKLTDAEMFDQSAERISHLREQIADTTEEIARMKADLQAEEQALSNLIERNVKGRNWTGEWILKRRAVGTPSDEALQKLETLDERLIRKDPGSVGVLSMNEMVLLRTSEILEKAGIAHIGKPIQFRAQTMSEVDKVLKSRQDLWGRIQEINELLDIKETRELKVFPSILGEALEQ